VYLTNIEQIQYDLKRKLNKVDSQKYANLKIPVMDQVVNEATMFLVRSYDSPRKQKKLLDLGFEGVQRTTDELYTLVKNDEVLATSVIGTTNNYVATIPTDYLYFKSAYALVSKGTCTNQKARCNVVQHDDEHEESPFDRSSFEWREVNIRWYRDGIKIFTDGTFTVQNLCLNYIKKPAFAHNAKDYLTGTYNLPGGIALTGSVNPELPEHLYGDIVDIAVLILTGELQMPDYTIKQQKLLLSN
jgi:hypothetical protein